MLILREYQTDIIHKTYNSMKNRHVKPLICLPTGAGKTVVFAWLANQTQNKNKTVWFLVHRRELLDQTVETFKKFNIPLNQIHIGMVATVANKPDKLPKPDLIIFDEGHHASANTWLKIIKHFPDAFLIGLTATPCRLDGKPLGDVYDDLIIGINPKLLIDQGYLSKYRYFAPSVADLSGLNKKGSDYDSTQAGDILSERAIFGDVIKHWRKYANGLQTICYCSSIKHSQATADAFRAEGIEAVHFDGNTPAAERKRIVEDFRSGKIKMLCNCDLVSEGFDMNEIDCCIMLRPTMSLGLFIQQAGRSLRPRNHKIAIILDCVGNYTRHGLPDDEREWSLTSRIKPKSRYGENGSLLIKQCPSCYFTFKSGPKECPQCGMKVSLSKEEIKNIKNIELVEIKELKRNESLLKISNGMQLHECKTLQDFQAYAKNKNYKSGWAYFQWKKFIKKHDRSKYYEQID